MIYLFSGSATHTVRAKAFQWIAASRKKAPEAPYMRLGASELTTERLAEVLGSQGLFFSKTLVLLDDPFSEKEAAELVLDTLDELAASPNPIAILAPNLLAAREKKIAVKAEKVFTFTVKEKERARGFNTPLVNALAARDGVTLWVELEKATRLNDAPELLHGLLHWKARELMQKGNASWSGQEARTLSLSLIELLSDSRGKELPLKESLERFALSLGEKR